MNSSHFSNQNSFIFYENFTELLIQNVGIEHNGNNFTCLATSESGIGSSEPVNLKVLCKFIYYSLELLIIKFIHLYLTSIIIIQFHQFVLLRN